MERNEMTKDEFFDEISQMANYCDKRLVENVYYGMIRVMGRHLKAGEKVRFPDWGHFELKNIAPRQAMAVRSGKIIKIGMVRSLKFKPSVKVKAFFRE
jgi:nucleoid DNA-binding protein